MFATLFYEVRTRTSPSGTELFVLRARGGRLKSFSLWQQKDAIMKFFCAKKEERDLMDNDSVIDPPLHRLMNHDAGI